jgi:hypothetical protein
MESVWTSREHARACWPSGRAALGLPAYLRRCQARNRLVGAEYVRSEIPKTRACHKRCKVRQFQPHSSTSFDVESIYPTTSQQVHDRSTKELSMADLGYSQAAGTEPIVPLEVTITIFKISDINLPAQTFSCDIFARATTSREILQQHGLLRTFDPQLEWINAVSIEDPVWRREELEHEVQFRFRSKGALLYNRLFVGSRHKQKPMLTVMHLQLCCLAYRHIYRGVRTSGLSM